MATLDVTGRWVGHYTQRDHQRGLRADLVQRGDRLSGSMTDEQVHFEMSVYEMAAECGLPPGADEQILAKLRQQFPDGGHAPVRALMTLPARSTIAGRVDGRTVTFVKTYEGESFTGYRVGEQRVGVTVEGHAVHYRGAVEAGGTLLEGTWWIEGNAKEGVKRTEGTFVLRRQQQLQA